MAPDLRTTRALLVTSLLVVIIPTTDDVAADPAGTPGWWPTHGLWMETQMLVPGEDPDELPPFLSFGSHLAIDGSTAVLTTQNSIYWDMGIFCPGTGKSTHFPQYPDGCDWAYVFEKGPDGVWAQTAKIAPADGIPGDTFAWAVDVDEKAGIIVIGNPGTRAETNTVHIFERQKDRAWNEAARIEKEYTPSPDVRSADFGTSVAVSGRTVAAADGNGKNASTFIFEKIDNEWVETAVVDGGGGPQGIDLAGDTLVTTPGWYEDPVCQRDGMIRIVLQIYQRNGDNWNISTVLDPQREFGNRTQTAPTRIALNEDGTRLLAGAAVDARVYGVHTEHCISVDPPAPIDPVQQSTRIGLVSAIGSAWIYERIDGEWVMTADIPNPMPHPVAPVFGASVAIEEDRAVIGAYGDPYNGGPLSGSAYIYDKIGEDWYLQSRLRNQDSSDYDLFGAAVGLSGQDVVIGSPSNGPTGSAHVFRIPGDVANLTNALTG